MLDEFVSQGLELEGLKQQEEETKKLIKKLVKTQSKKSQDRKNQAKDTRAKDTRAKTLKEVLRFLKTLRLLIH